MVKSGGPAHFSADGPCPASPKELQSCVLRFICGSPDFGPFPASIVGLNAAIRRAYQRAGHERAALGVFRATSTADAVRAIRTDLLAAGHRSALVLEDGAASDDLLIMDADRQRIHRVLLAKMANGESVQQQAAVVAKQVAATGAAHEDGSQTPGGQVDKSVDFSRSTAGRARRALDVDEEIMQLLAEPTVKRQDWGVQAAQQAEGEEERQDGAGAAEPGAEAHERSRSRRRRRRRQRSSSSASGANEEENGRRRGGRDRKRRRRRESSQDAPPADPAATGSPALPLPDPGPHDALAAGGGPSGMPPPGSTFVFTPDAHDSMLDVPLPEPTPRRSVSSVPLFEWVSANSLTDLKPAVRGKGGEGRGRGRRSRSRGEGPDDPGKGPGDGRPPEKLGGDTWEEPRGKTGLQLLGDTGGGQWAYPLLDEARRSFAGYLHRALPAEDCQVLFERIRSGTIWQQPEGPLGALPRKTCWMVGRGCTCTYRYGGIEVSPQEFPPWMQELLGVVMPLCGLKEPDTWPNSCNLNLYVDGGMSVGWHSDDERLFQGKFSDCRIVSLSLGTRRKFEMRLNWPEEGERQSWQVFLGDGDLLTMEGMMQKHFQHRVPREDNVTAPRINLTWRWVARHAPRCPVERPRRS
uniref:Fe2OG dioxygenase domain-containing protein n=1 Tax=Alexandrium monilatum TaxID=311494 RepID=A0A7S4VXA8_9DINO